MPSISEIVFKNQNRHRRRQRKPRFKKHSRFAIDASLNDMNNITNVIIPEKVRRAGWMLIDTHSYPPTAFVNANHKQYFNKQFKIGICKSKSEFGYLLYPIVDSEDDLRDIGYCIDSSLTFSPTITSNSYKSFWDTRRGKRFSRYIAYRKQRQNKCDEYNKMNKKN